MSKVRLILARHGNTFNPGDKIVYVGAKTDLPLTEHGLQQAKNLGEYLKNKNINPCAIYCGNLKRQQQTAQNLSQVIKFDLSLIKSNTSALDEVDYGPWEGLTESQILQGWPEKLNNWTTAGVWPKDIFSGSFINKQTLLKNWCKDLLNLHSNSTVVAVSSNGIIRLILSLLPEVWQKITDNKSFIEYKIKTGNFCELEINNSNINIVQWNVCPQ